MSDTNLTLSLTFDADQTSSLLVCNTLTDCSPTKGIYAGMLALQVQSPLNVVVSGNGAFNNPNGGPAFSGFEINDFSIISRPNLITCGPNETPAYAPPSPFNDTYVATKSITWEGTSRSRSTEKYLVIQDTLTDSLKLGGPGSWNLTIVLTILIKRVDGSSGLRVFYADIDTLLYPQEQ